MTTTYTYSIQNDFPNHLVSSDRLTREINASAITIALDRIDTDILGDVCTIVFKADLSQGDTVVLAALVAAHSGEEFPNAVQDVCLYSPTGKPLAITSTGSLVSTVVRPINPKVTVITPNWCDKCTWYSGSILVEDEVATDSGNHTTYILAHPFVIDVYHGRITFEDILKDSNNNSYRVKVWVDDIRQDEQDPHLGTGGDYTVDYENGEIVFLEMQQPTAEVIVTYHYATSSLFKVQPTAGKCLIIDRVELQLSADLVMNDTILFQPYGLVDVFAPQLMPGIPSGTKIPLGDPLVYKTVLDLINDSNSAHPAYPALGGAGWRGYSKAAYILTWEYAVGTTALSSAAGMEIWVSMQHDCVNEGEYATATFYCTSEAE
jgi:hypothetical protein